MRGLLVVLALVIGSAQAQVPALLTPTPLGTILSVFSYLNTEKKKVYYARVESQGKTFNEARVNGFRLAVEQAIGPLILSESQSQGARLRRDQIISYSSGVIYRFEIVEKVDTGRGWKLVMEVWVTHSAIAGRLLNDSVTDRNIIGDQLGARVESLLHERRSGDQVVAAVARDYATRAFDVELQAPKVDFDAQRNLQITVPFVIDMNYAYAVALYESMNRTAQAPLECSSIWDRIRYDGRETPECQSRKNNQYHFVISMKPVDRWQFWNGRVTFDDPNKLQIFAQAVAQPLVLGLSLLDIQGQIVIRTCHDLEPYTSRIISYNQNNNTLLVQQGRPVAGEIQFNFGQDHARITRLSTQQARVMPQSQCRT